MNLRALAAALAASLAMAGFTGCAVPSDCHSPSPYSLYDRPGHGVEGLVQIICDTQPRSYDVHVTLEYRYKLFTPWLIRGHRLDEFVAPYGPVVGHLYEYRVTARCQPGWWRMVVFAEGTSSTGQFQEPPLLRHVPRYRGMRIRHCR